MSILRLLRQKNGQKALAQWLWGPREIWMGALVTTAIIVWVFQLGTEQALRISSGILQLLGVMTVIYGLDATQQFFERPRILSAPRHWLSQTPLTVNHQSLDINGSIGLDARCYGYLTINATADSDFDTHLRALRDNLDLLQKYASNLHKIIDDNAEKTHARMEEEARARLQQDQAILRRLEAFGTNGTATALVGTFLLLLGVASSTLSPELSTMLAGR